MSRSQFRLTGKKRDSYLELVQDFPLISIQSAAHLAEAQRIIDEMTARQDLGPGESLYLDALSDLVGCYEDKHHAIKSASDADILQHLMDAKQVSQSEVSRETGLPKSSISEVLSGKKKFSRTMIRKLADYFAVSVDVLAANL